MRIRELADLVDSAAPATDLEGDLEVNGVSHNAEWVTPGDAYVAIRGARVDGHTFIDAAATAGAVVVIGDGLPAGTECALPYLRVPNARAALADAAAAFAGHPSSRLDVIGVTGTDGKTTTSWLTRHLLRGSGYPTGLLSTVGYELPDGVLRDFPSHFTTPEAPQLQRTLAEMVTAGATAVVLEVSSHSLAMGRVRGVDFATAVWTNLSSEHLELHGSMEQYFADKALLIRDAHHAVINAECPWGRRLIGVAPTTTTYSATGGEADWRASVVVENADHLKFTVDSPLGQFPAQLPMVGSFNVANALAAMAATAITGTTVANLQRGLAAFPGVPGRMQLIESPATSPRVVIDFAHTAVAVENLLTTLRPSVQGKLWIVVGSAGERDPTKRGPIGEVASRLADVAVFTEEDPRGTPIEEILQQIAAGAGDRTNFHLIADRTEAINFAIGAGGVGDTVVLAGKGPEPTMQRGDALFPWDEENLARSAIAARSQ